MRVLFGCISFFVLFLFGSCSLFEDPLEQTQVDVKDEFRLELNQMLLPGPNPLEIVISTIDPPNCEESKIRIIKSQEDAQIFLGILDVFNPQTCEYTNDIIQESAIYSLKNGQFEFVLDLNASSSVQLQNSISNIGSLSSTIQSYTLQMETENGFEFGNLEVYKIPDHLLWGYMIVTYEEELSLFDEFKDHLAGQVDEKISLLPGSYGYFNISDDQKIDIAIKNNPVFAKKFIFHSNTSPSDLSARFNDFRALHSNVTIFGQHSEGLEL